MRKKLQCGIATVNNSQIETNSTATIHYSVHRITTDTSRTATAGNWIIRILRRRENNIFVKGSWEYQ